MIQGNNPCQYNQVYYVETADKNRVNPVAIKPEILESWVQWQDTSKGKIVPLGVISKIDSGKFPPDSFEITSKEGDHYRLTKLTLEIYNKNVKNRVMLPPDFNSDEEVQEFYLNSDFE